MANDQQYSFLRSILADSLQGGYEFDTAKSPKPFVLYDMPQIDQLEEAVELAMTGNPIAFPIKFIGSTYRRYDKTGKLIEMAMPDFRLPALVLGSFARQKLMQVTDLGSGRGSVKELDGHSDWSIDLVGIVISETNHPQGVADFKQMLEHITQWDSLMSSIEVSSELLTALGIYRVVIKSVGFGQQEGVEDNIDFTMSLISDEEFELEIIE